ncbi:beta-ketoacyl-[acyl-carrier-protein] synthase family protein [Synechococcus sp. BA-124 BA4]|uniref:beta-ketoacyl-[acyl-carrier-protein] synthase family protein n=1 Tax=Synechococcus sp. BA-124 BA4 TaxID=3110251 RepID=UPI002B1FE02E|nr:beta-ketoacyl-[acyl-carrier-protein] synthase family protein [Synechococcus sp. BA-124 BA4]MEA5400718.1 beta-ketoacyl-[acyl-carrier-protein] synthase family protein [Synechococcus sp. BA-124 BA4]MEA5411756.1 beta-ketoacyl-[acyl-carrier-protein] synthase family protein [Synechococcus sp. BA-120 BA3]
MSSQYPIAVTGMGCMSPLGCNPNDAFAASLNGFIASANLYESWASGRDKYLAATVQTMPESLLGEFLANRLDRFSQFALLAARQAWSASGLGDHDVLGGRLAVVLGTGIGGQSTLIQQYERNAAGARRIHPLAVAMAMPNAAAAQVAIDLGAHGGAHAPVSACSSGAEAIIWGQMLLASDHADVVVVGGAEAPIHLATMRGFAEMRALSCRHEDPQSACRPFAEGRDGFVLGEGAGALVLERLRDAEARHAPIEGLLLAAGMTSDAHHLAMPQPDGLHAAEAIRKALRGADARPEDLSMISAHATGTPLGDMAEAQALRLVLGSATDHVWVTAPKAGLGHLLGAAGAVESILTLKALQKAVVPRSLNSDPPDPQIPLRVARNRNENLSRRSRHLAIKNSFGFGGHNVSLLWASA